MVFDLILLELNIKALLTFSLHYLKGSNVIRKKFLSQNCKLFLDFKLKEMISEKNKYDKITIYLLRKMK